MDQPQTIFLVDDDEDDRMLLREALYNAVDSVTIIDVEHSESLLDHLRSERETARLILMDMNMPRVNGLEMLDSLKKDQRYQHIPVVMISTTTTPAMVTKACDMGANAFIVKPVTAQEYDQVASGVALCFLNNYRHATAQPIPRLTSHKTIVIVEDCDDHWHLFDNALRNSPMNYHVVHIKTKPEALAFVQGELTTCKPPVDMILIDLYLPDREDGLSLLADTRQALTRNHLEKIPVVVFTYSDSTQDIDDCYRKQANAYIVKPFDVSGWQFYFENVLGFWSNSVQAPLNS